MLDVSREDDAHTAHRLATEAIAWLGTTGRDGRPHAVPVWFCWEDPLAVVFSLPTARKVADLRRRPACTLGLETADGGDDVVIVEGEATLVELGAPEIASLTAAFARKYEPLLAGITFDQWVQGFGQPILVRATRVVAWSKPDGRLRYRAVP